METEAIKTPIIYLIDDDFIYHSITEMLLERASKPCELKSFNNGREALEQLRQDSKNPESMPDLILLDINMPVMNGWDFLSEFNLLASTLPKQPRINMMTSSSLDSDLERAMQFKNVEGFVTKPITLDQLENLTEPASV